MVRLRGKERRKLKEKGEDEGKSGRARIKLKGRAEERGTVHEQRGRAGEYC